MPFELAKLREEDFVEALEQHIMQRRPETALEWRRRMGKGGRERLTSIAKHYALKYRIPVNVVAALIVEGILAGVLVADQVNEHDLVIM